MKQLFQHLRGVFIAFAALALSTGMVLGAQPEASLSGLANASTHAGKTVPVKAGQREFLLGLPSGNGVGKYASNPAHRSA